MINRIVFDSRGYTLLEMVVVLALLGLMAGLSMPRLEKMYEGMQYSMQRSEALRCIASLGFQAWVMQKKLILDRYPSMQTTKKRGERDTLDTSSVSGLTETIFPLPENWTVVTSSPVYFYKNGTCSGGEIALSFQDRTQDFALSPPFCLPKPLEKP